MSTVDFTLDGRNALVTGAASGIGHRIATDLAEAGAGVACLDLPGPELDALVATIEMDGGRAVAVPANVTDPGELRDAVERAESVLGPLTLAVNSAGIANAAPAEEMPLAQWKRVIDVNVTGVFLSCQARRERCSATAAARS